jgi:hypothetical protein
MILMLAYVVKANLKWYPATHTGRKVIKSNGKLSLIAGCSGMVQGSSRLLEECCGYVCKRQERSSPHLPNCAKGRCCESVSICVDSVWSDNCLIGICH